MSGVTREDQYILAGDEESGAENQRLLRWIAIVFKFVFKHFLDFAGIDVNAA